MVNWNSSQTSKSAIDPSNNFVNLAGKFLIYTEQKEQLDEALMCKEKAQRIRSQICGAKIRPYIQEHQFLLAQQFAAKPLYHASMGFPPENFQMLVALEGFLLSYQDDPHLALPEIKLIL